MVKLLFIYFSHFDVFPIYLLKGIIFQTTNIIILKIYSCNIFNRNLNILYISRLLPLIYIKLWNKIEKIICGRHIWNMNMAWYIFLDIHSKADVSIIHHSEYDRWFDLRSWDHFLLFLWFWRKWLNKWKTLVPDDVPSRNFVLNLKRSFRT